MKKAIISTFLLLMSSMCYSQVLLEEKAEFKTQADYAKEELRYTLKPISDLTCEQFEALYELCLEIDKTIPYISHFEPDRKLSSKRMAKVERLEEDLFAKVLNPSQLKQLIEINKKNAALREQNLAERKAKNIPDYTGQMCHYFDQRTEEIIHIRYNCLFIKNRDGKGFTAFIYSNESLGDTTTYNCILTSFAELSSGKCCGCRGRNEK